MKCVGHEQAGASGKRRAWSHAALGRQIKIEFRLQSDNLDSYAGWYIDDVAVTVP